LNHDGATLGALVIDGRHASEQQLLLAQPPLRSLGAVTASVLQREQHLRAMELQREHISTSHARMVANTQQVNEARDVLAAEARNPATINALSQLMHASHDLVATADAF